MKPIQDCCRYLVDDGTQCSNPKMQDSSLCEQHANWLPADLEVYRAVTEHFRQDVREFWARSNFYLLVQAGLLSVFVAVSPASSFYGKITALTLSILGLVIATVWFIVLKGAVLWIRRWRDQTIKIDNVIDRHRVYEKVESFAYSSPIMSPSNVTQYLPIFFGIAWIALATLSLVFLE